MIWGACSTGNCRENRENRAVKGEETVTIPPLPETSQAIDRIRVYKYDGSLQCGQGRALSVDEMKKELDGLQVHGGEKKSDGLMRTQVCGSPTGMANVYEIDKKDLEGAKKRGFKVWSFD